MIYDCHTHIWPDRRSLGQAEKFSCLADPATNQAVPADHAFAAQHADASFVLGFIADHLGVELSNDDLAAYAHNNPGRVIPFAGFDPTRKNAPDRLDDLARQNTFAGITLSPACQAFHPADSRAMACYEAAQQLRLPIYFLNGQSLPAPAMLPFANPTLLDEVAQSFPHLTLIISHLGFPFIEQTFALLAKHPNLFADTAGLPGKLNLTYRVLNLACELRLTDKLLLASDFPSCTVRQAAESLYNANKIAPDCILPPLPRDLIRAIVERDTLTTLNLQRFKPQKS